MALDWLFERWRSFDQRPALIWRGQTFSYADLAGLVARHEAALPPDLHALMLVGDYSPQFLAAFLATLKAGRIAIPVTPGMAGQLQDFAALSAADEIWRSDETGHIQREAQQKHPRPDLYKTLAERRAPGLVIFSSGTTGAPKAILHDSDRLTLKHRDAQTALRTVALPPPDHMAGLDTLFYSLAGGGTLIVPSERSPEAVCRAVAEFKAELLPTTPSFLNLLTIAGSANPSDLASLRMVTYGSEVMSESTLRRARELLPHCRFIQKYGATEFGSPRSRSREDGSVWFRMDSAGYEFKIVDSILWIRSQSSMLGYLNAPSPFDAEGWFNTGDMVEVDGDYIRVLGRRTDMINVGGHKVLPQEVEDVILALSNVRDCAIHGEPNAMLGRVVAARVSLVKPEPFEAFKIRLREHCRAHLPSYKVPVRVEVVEDVHTSARMKKARPADPAQPA